MKKEENKVTIDEVPYWVSHERLQTLSEAIAIPSFSISPHKPVCKQNVYVLHEAQVGRRVGAAYYGIRTMAIRPL